VEEAAAAAGARPEDFIKSICMVDSRERTVVAIVKGEDRVDLSRVARALGIEKLRLMTPGEMIERTGFPCGGTPPFGFDAPFLIDSRVMEMDRVYGGGGSEYSLVRVSPGEILRANGGRVVKVKDS
jgi:Cys-tRNA(Pro)/Cys-tRNA(Cys) deacylase